MDIFKGKVIAEQTKVPYWKIAEFFRGVRSVLTAKEISAIQKYEKKQSKALRAALISHTPKPEKQKNDIRTES